MAVIYWICFLMLLHFMYCYENLAMKPESYVELSTMLGHNYPARANDGDLRQNILYCSHTDNGQSKAWLRVNLGERYQIQEVKIFYRNSEIKTDRFNNFYIDVSNNTFERYRCYTDNKPGTPAEIETISCRHIAQYVTVETTYFSHGGVYLEIAEIQVFGCSIQVNNYQCPNECIGDHSCGQTCSENCKGDCNRMTGECINGCKEGWRGIRCDKCALGQYGQTCSSTCFICKNKPCTGLSNGCDDTGCSIAPQNCEAKTNKCKSGYFGAYCASKCSPNCMDGTCDQQTGACSSCKNKWTGIFCNECPVGNYGDNCIPCSVNCKSLSSESGQLCNNFTGVCIHGCTEGWRGEHCNEMCRPFTYGETCSKTCSVFCENKICDRFTGRCDSCMNNRYGKFCEYSCERCNSSCDRDDSICNNCKTGFFGQNCMKNCSITCFGKVCEQTNGHCLSCKPGFKGTMCEECESGKFGQKCSDSCGGNCVNITCSRNGECDGGCKNGWTGSQCDSPCPEGFYGGKCLEQCNHNCAAGCNHIHGDCIQGCSAVGLQPKRCDSRCLPRYYGLNCVSLCSSGCAESGLCHPENGTCVAGCNPGYSGNLCLSEIDNLKDDTKGSTIPYIGAVVGILLLLAIAIVSIVYIRKRHIGRKNYQHQHEGVTLEQQNPIPFSVIIEDPEEEPIREDPAEAVYYNNLSAAKDIDVKDLLLVIEDKEQKENAGFTKEFKELPYGERFDCNTAKLEENIPKNRFKTTFPYNHSRVVLQIDDEFSSDYINANYIENMEGTRAYIASQGPKENTLVDHWRMIWQEKVNYIVMLTSLIEGRKVKCHQYWPDENDKLEIGPFTIHLTEEKQYTNFIKRTMTLKKREVTKPRTVVQFHYTRWPDHGTPNPLNLTNFHEHFKHNSFISNSPVLVHCSAGIGRTGTLIALDALEKYGRKTGKFNVIEFVRAMRKNRMSMIQNIDQYIFLYHALYETFRRKSVFIKRHDFTRIFSQTDKRETRKQITDEFNDLTKLKPKYDASDYRSGKKYLNMNAVKTVLPVERYLVYLSSSLRGREPYYNAVTLSSFTSAEEFISAQHPVPGAGVDLLLLLTEQACPFLISLNPIEDINEVNHWFNDKEKHITIGPFGITKVDQKRFTEEVRKTIIKVQRKQEKGSHTIQIFECLDWNTADFIPEKCSTLIELIKQFCLDRRSNPEGQITILSRDGATCCGVFCAVYNAIEQLQQDDEVDIFTIVQQLQCRRPEMISNKEEYEFCYKAVCAYLETENIYANTSS